MFKKSLTLLLILLLIIPTASVLADGSITYLALESIENGTLTGGYWNEGSLGYSLDWKTDHYPDVVWEINVETTGLYDVTMNYKADWSNLLDYVYLDEKVIATSSNFVGYTSEYTDVKLNTVYLTEGKHTVKMTEAENIGGFYIAALTLTPSSEVIPIVNGTSALRIENEGESNGKVDITNKTLTKRVIAPKAGLYTLALSWASWTPGKADIIVNGETVHAAVEPTLVYSSGGDYLYGSNYFKDYYSIPLEVGVNEISLKATSYIYVDFMEIVSPVAGIPGAFVEINAQPNHYKEMLDISFNQKHINVKVNTEKAGEYNLTINWSGYNGTDTATIIVNGESAGSFKPTQYDTSNYNKPIYFKEDTYKINLNEGENTIYIKADSGKYVYMDRIKVTYTGLAFSKASLKALDNTAEYDTIEAAKNAGDSVSVVTNAENTSSSAKTFTLIVASYDGNKNLIDVKPFAETVLNVGETTSLKADIVIKNATKIKVFAFDNLDDITPIYTFEDIK